MESLQKPEVIITHESDLDGFVSGLLLQKLARKLFDFDPRLETYHYDNWRTRVMRERVAWVADFTFETRIDKPGWLVIDHHPTSVTPKQARLVHDAGKSAGLLCYNLCREHGIVSDELERLVHLSNVADLFLDGDADFLPALDYAGLLKTYYFWNLHSLIGGQLEKLLNHPLLEVMHVKRRVEDPLGLAWSKTNLTPITSCVALVPLVVGNANLILYRLLNDPAISYQVLITFVRKGSGNLSVSIRSRNNEALKIAMSLQGGGHGNAAGATLPRSVQNFNDAVDYLKKMLVPQPVMIPKNQTLESLFDGAPPSKS